MVHPASQSEPEIADGIASRDADAREKGFGYNPGVKNPADNQMEGTSATSLSADTSGAHPLFSFAWLGDASRAERSSLIAGGLGWMLDAMDVSLYALVLAVLVSAFGMTTKTAGWLGSLTLIASAIGGFLFGVLADRIGRVRALMASILVYALASAACGFTQTIPQLAVFRFILGLGMGGEWTTAAALIAETWRAEHRGKALGLMQSAYAIGEAVAAIVVLVVLPKLGWRAVFLVGVLPALLVFWIQARVPDPDSWKQRKDENKSVRLGQLLEKKILRNGILATLMNACTMFGYWGLFTWIPAYLKLPASQGGRGLGLAQTMGFFLLMCPGKWLGYSLFGFFADAFGRRKPYFLYLVIAAALVPIYGMSRSAVWLMALGPFVAFFGTGYFSGYAAIVSELFPGEIRAAAMGLSYNVGRGLSAFAPYAVGVMAQRFGIGKAFFVEAGAFLAAALLSLTLPETRGQKLD